MEKFCNRCEDQLVNGTGEDPFCPTCEFPRTITHYPIVGVHIFLRKGWWYFYKGTPVRQEGRVQGGFQEFGAVAAKIRGGDVGVREWAKAHPR